MKHRPELDVDIEEAKAKDKQRLRFVDRHWGYPCNPWHHAPTEQPPTNKYVIIKMRNGDIWVGKFGYHGKAHKQQWSSGGFRLYTEDILWWMNPEDLPATPEIPT